MRYCLPHWRQRVDSTDYTDPARARAQRMELARAQRLEAQRARAERRRKHVARVEALVAAAPSRVKTQRRDEERAKGFTDEQIDERARREMRQVLTRSPGVVFDRQQGQHVRGEDYYDFDIYERAGG
jgi:hypothetical protein